MQRIECRAPAKINLSLDVVGKRQDGYHELKMIMQTLHLHDIVYLDKTQGGISIQCSHPYIPSDSGNIAYKAAALLMEECGVQGGIQIFIEKNIPVAAGLGGGSSDAAAVLKGMNVLYSLGLDHGQLRKIGLRLGADVPYFIDGGTALAEGIGERLTGLDKLAGVDILLVMPKFGVSTAWVYKNLVLENIVSRPDTGMLIEAVREKRLDVLSANMQNVLETVTIQKYGVLAEIKEKLVKGGALGSLMSGSGPSVFGIFQDKPSAIQAYERMADSRWERYLTYTE